MGEMAQSERATGGKSPFDDLSRRAHAIGLRDCAV